MNRLDIIGNLTRDPELKNTKAGNDTVAVCNFTVAANSGFGDHRKTEFVRVNVWRGQAESCAKYLRKGSKVSISGPATVSAYLNNEGKPAASLELRADSIEFLSPASAAEQKEPSDDIDELL